MDNEEDMTEINTTLAALEQISQTIEVMSGLVTRLQDYLLYEQAIDDTLDTSEDAPEGRPYPYRTLH